MHQLFSFLQSFSEIFLKINIPNDSINGKKNVWFDFIQFTKSNGTLTTKNEQ